jgi:hypothetical protein
MAKRVWDEETKKKLSGLLPFAPGSFIRWTPDPFLFLPEGERPVFHVCPFDADTRKKIQEAAAAGAFSDQTCVDALKQAVPYWENLPDMGTMEDVPYGDFEALPAGLIWELYAKAQSFTVPTREEKEGLG